MQANQTPTLVPLAFAANGTKNVIPEASQITITPGAASLNDGFPPLTFTPVAAGGVPPAGGDFNGILNLITASIRWAHGGGLYAFNSSFAADANVTGYPQGAELLSADLQGTWISLNDSNTDNPDTGAGTKWVPGRAYGVTPVTGLVNANVTLTPAQAAKNKITLAGALTGNVQIIFPTWLREWSVVNSTTGAFTVTAKTAGGTGIVLAAGQQKITGDGTNITQPAENIAPPSASQHAAQFANIGNFQGIQSVNSNVTLTSASFGLVYEAATGDPGGRIITFPTASGNGGKAVALINSSSGNWTLNAGNINCSYGSGTSVVMPPNSTGVFVSDNTSFNAIAGSAGFGGGVRPQVAAGVGQWGIVPTTGSGASTFYTLPAGGSWAYMVSNNGSGNAGIAAGGSNVFGPFTPANLISFCWRIA